MSVLTDVNPKYCSGCHNGSDGRIHTMPSTFELVTNRDRVAGREKRIGSEGKFPIVWPRFLVNTNRLLSDCANFVYLYKKLVFTLSDKKTTTKTKTYAQNLKRIPGALL